MSRKKAQNSDAKRSRIHGEIDVLKFQILFCKYMCTSYLGEIFDSRSTRPFLSDPGVLGSDLCVRMSVSE